MGAKKVTKGKARYYGRVDIAACIEGISKVREVIIDDLELYPEDMDLDKVSEEELIDANFRHLMKMQAFGFDSKDLQTGRPHLHHIQTNCMFLERKRRKKEKEAHVNSEISNSVGSVVSVDSSENYHPLNKLAQMLD